MTDRTCSTLLDISQRLHVIAVCMYHCSFLPWQHLLWRLNLTGGMRTFDVAETGTQDRCLVPGCLMCPGSQLWALQKNLDLILNLLPQSGFAHQTHWMLWWSFSHCLLWFLPLFPLFYTDNECPQEPLPGHQRCEILSISDKQVRRISAPRFLHLSNELWPLCNFAGALSSNQ